MTVKDLVFGKEVLPREWLGVYEGKNCFVTGCAGSIGREVFSMLEDFGAVVSGLDFNENGVMSMLREGKNVFLGDVARQVNFFGHDVIFHCAAYKHVLAGERFQELWDNNSRSTRAVSDLSDPETRVVMASTDKAAGSSAMGLSKLACEKELARRGNATSVRLVNCAYSSGSVLALWKEAMQAGSVPKLCPPEVRRYWFQLSDAAYALLCAGLLPDGRYVVTGGLDVEMGDLWDAMCERMEWDKNRFDSLLLSPQETRSESLIRGGESLEDTPHAWLKRVTT